MQKSSGSSSIERSALLVTTLTAFVGPFMISSINVALPSIVEDFKINAVSLSWIATSYLLSMAIGLVPAGKAADIYGRKRLFQTGLILYTIASTMAAFAPNIAILLSCRVVQGFSASLFTTTGMAIVLSVFPPEKRGRVIGVIVSATYIGLAIGPSIGGVLTQQFGWRSIFLAMLPSGLLCIAVTRRFLKGDWAGAAGQKLDVPGSIIYGVSIFMLVYGATLLPNPLACGLIPAGMLGLVVFFKRQQRQTNPVFEVTLFTENRTFTYSSLAALLNYSSSFAVTFIMSLYLQYIKAMTPQQAGMILMTQPIMMALFSPFCGLMADRVEPRILASIGMLANVLGMVILTQIHDHTSIHTIVGILAWLGLGYALFSSPNMSAIMGSVRKEQYSIASGTVSTMRLLGQMTSMAMATVVLALMVGRGAIEPQQYGRFLDSAHVVFTISALLSTVGVYFSMNRGRLRG